MPAILESSRWPEYGQIDPELDEFLKAQPEMRNITPTYLPRAQDARAAMDEMTKFAPQPDLSVVSKSEIQIPVRDGTTIRALLLKPAAATTSATTTTTTSQPPPGGPLAVLYHGGGWTVGNPEMQQVDASMLVQRHGAVCLSIDYRMAPEHPFPVPVEDSWDALQWAAANASSLGADPTKGFIIGGSSAGANISAVCSHLARDTKMSPPLTGVWLHIPATIAPEMLPEKYKDEFKSYEQNDEAPLLGGKDIKYFRDFYAPEVTSPFFSPMIWPTGHAGLPKTYFAIAGMDPLRDDGLLYERELREAGVKTDVVVYPGVPHSFEAYAHLKMTQKSIKDREGIFDWLMEKE